MVSMVNGETGLWFRSRISKVIGNGRSENFWEGVWAGEQPLKSRFPRLFHLSANKEGSVGEMGNWVNGSWNWKLIWRRDLFERELVIQEDLMRLLQNVNVLEGKEDEWKWGKNGFTVKEAYGGILESFHLNYPNVASRNAARSIWKVAAPFKVKVTAWRLLWNRLPTADNLKCSTALTEDERKCHCYKAEEESASHFFLRCPNSEGVWNCMVDWIGINWSPPSSIESHFISFRELLGGGLMKKKLGGLWSCVIWVLWNWRNGMIFDKREWDPRKIEEEIKCRFWCWSEANLGASMRVSFLDWSRNKLCNQW